jgi:hypothetical protein
LRIDDMSGAGWTAFGTRGSGDGQFDHPGGIAVGPLGRIFVVDRNNARLVRIDDLSGTGWTTLAIPSGSHGIFVR